MRIHTFAWALLPAVLCGCGRPEPGDAPTAPFITPEQRARMGPEERDDPYTLKHLQPTPARPRR